MCHNDLVFIAVSLSDTTLYPSPRSSLCIFFHYFHVTKKRGYINKFKKKRPMNTWVKFQKLCHNPTVHFPASRQKKKKKKKPKSLLNRTHSFLHFGDLQAKFFKFFKFTFCLLTKFPANYTNSMLFAQKSRE